MDGIHLGALKPAEYAAFRALHGTDRWERLQCIEEGVDGRCEIILLQGSLAVHQDGITFGNINSLGASLASAECNLFQCQ